MESIQDLLISKGFVWVSAKWQFEKGNVAIPATALAGHTVRTFAGLAREKGWFSEQKEAADLTIPYMFPLV